MGIPQLCANVALATVMAASTGKPKISDVRISVDDAPNLSKVVRSDTEAFFTYIERPSVAHALKPYADFTGVIQGDPHAGNVAPTLVQTTEGKFEIRMVTNDFDNVGVGSFVWEFVHNVVQAKAIDSIVKIPELLEAYLEGLDGKAAAVPDKLQKILDMSYADYRFLRHAYVAKKVENGKLIRKLGKVENYRGPYTLADMQKLFPEGKVMDLAHRIEDEGGNTGERLWILVQDTDGELIIKELKDYQADSLAMVSKQPPLAEWDQLIHAKLWPGLNPEMYNLVTMKDGKVYWRREKAVTMLDVPRSSDKTKAKEFRRAIVLFDANFFGLSAGSQAQGAAFAKAIRIDKDAFIAMTKIVVHPYLKAASKVVDE